jgi:hypothetical protein
MDFSLITWIVLDNEDEIVALNQCPSFNVPDEKVPVMMELINLMNRIYGPYHLFFHRETKRVVLHQGIMIENSVLDKKEFDTSIRYLFVNGRFFFSIVKEQISSNDSPEMLLAKAQDNIEDSQ